MINGAISLLRGFVSEVACFVFPLYLSVEII